MGMFMVDSYEGGFGVGVAGPYFAYFWSMASLISGSGLPSAFIRITSRVMSRQTRHAPPCEVKVTVPACARLM
jgi:hypothetical protein